MPLESCSGDHGASKYYRAPKNVDYNQRKRSEMPEITSFHNAAGVIYRGPKNVDYTHENGQKCSKSLVFTMPLESCIGGHEASKSSRDPKNVDYSPRKRSEMPEITSFHDAARVMYRGSRGIEILPAPKKRGL